MKKIIADEAAVGRMLDRLACEIIECHPDMNEYRLVGIKTRGAFIAKRLQERIAAVCGARPQLAELDITLYRDDLTQVAQDPQLKSSGLGTDIDGKTVILADDVLYTGRTVLCALNALASFGRARKVEFLTMVDRGHHQLPLCADFMGRFVPTGDEDIIHVHLKERDGDDKIVHNIGGQKEAAQRF